MRQHGNQSAPADNELPIKDKQVYPNLLGLSQGLGASPSIFTVLTTKLSIYINNINIMRLNPTTRTNDEASNQERGGKNRQMEELDTLRLV
jgi:hypothetical protein